MADFRLGRIKFKWQGLWTTATEYVVDDVVRNGASSYVCVINHTSGGSFATDLAASRWELMLEGGTPTTTLGDMIYRGVSADVRLPIGTQGQALMVNSAGIPAWTGLVEAENVYYVSEDGDNANDGRNLNKAFKTIKYACTQVTGPAVIFVKTGTYHEQLPIVVPAGVSVYGDGQRTTEVTPIYITANGVTRVATSGAQTSTTLIVQNSQVTGDEWQVGATLTGTGIGGTVTITAITLNTPTSGFTTLAVSFTSQVVTAGTVNIASDYRTSTMWRLSDASMLHKMYFTGMTGFTPNMSFPEDITQATVQGVYVALNPASPITTKSPYVLECSSFSTGGVGAVVDGTVHGSGFKSIVFHAYTCINDDGVGFWVNGDGKSEIVSCFTYFCWFGYTTTAGGKIRALNGNNSYGRYGVVSRGFDAAESTNNGAIYGDQIAYNGNSLSGEFVVGETITGSTSGATGTITNVQTASDKFYYISVSGSFQNSETITGGTSAATAIIDSSGVTGQKGFVLVADGFSAEPRPGGSIEFTSGDSNSYVIQSVSGTYTNSSSVMILVLAGEKITASGNNVGVRIRYNYSQSRLTGHDFLSIGTGNKSTTNYPGTPSQAASQANEVIESFPGRVYYVSTDQDGNFRVGDYFRVDQATGRATLNASAFDLSGLTSLRLGSIGAQLGELVNEFSSDDTLSGNSNLAVPTEFATRNYFTKIATNVVPVADDVQTLGTPSKRWRDVYVGPGSVNIGALTISESSGQLRIERQDSTLASINISEMDTGSIRYFQNNIIGTNSNEDIVVDTSGTGDVIVNSDLRITGELQGPATFYIDPAALGDNTGTVIIRGNLQVDGTTTTINSTTLTIDDKNIVLGDGAPNDAAADGSGITVASGDGNKTWNWVDATDSWTSSEHINLLTGKSFKVNGVDVLSGTTLGSGITSSSLTSVGTLTSLTVNSGNVLVGGTGVRASTVGTAHVDIFNGTAPAGTLTNGISLYSVSGDFNFMDAAGSAYKVGYRNVPAVGAKSSSYILATSDVGKYVQVTAGGAITIPNSTFAEGDVVSIFNNTGSNVTITCSIATAYIAGIDDDKATITLATRGVATILFISATVCVVSGNVS